LQYLNRFSGLPSNGERHAHAGYEEVAPREFCGRRRDDGSRPVGLRAAGRDDGWNGDRGGGPAEVTVGVVTSETGPLAGYGKQYLDGFKAGLDYATDGSNEVDGTKITVDYRDDAGDPTRPSASQRSSSVRGEHPGGQRLVGVAAAVAEQAGQNKVLFISGPAAADALTGVNAYTFRSGRQSAQDVATAGTFLGDLTGKTVTVFAQNNAFGKGNEAAVTAILGGKGATVNSVLVAEDVTEFTPFAQQVLAAKPDLVFVAGPVPRPARCGSR
jgi:branched-chain amino acid transport system substrate-binding protein